MRALRRTPESAENFPQDVLEVQAFLAPAGPNQRIRAIPAAGTEVPLWILGSSNFGAMLAAELGLPYAFASHFAPALLDQALRVFGRIVNGCLQQGQTATRPSGQTYLLFLPDVTPREAVNLVERSRQQIDAIKESRFRDSPGARGSSSKWRRYPIADARST